MKIACSHQIVDDNNSHILGNAIHNPYLSPLFSSKSIASNSTICTINEEETCGGLLNQQLESLLHVANSSQKLKMKRTTKTKYMDNCPKIDRILNKSRMRSHLKTIILNGRISSNLCNKKQA